MLRHSHLSARAGFSLIEATVMLAVAGMALMLIFGVASRASQQGFRLGRQALAATDGELAQDSFRDVVAALEIAAAPANPAEASFTGTAEALQGRAVLARSGLCGEAGPATVRLEVQRTSTGDQLVCRRGGVSRVVLQRPGRLGLAYSEDGRSWTRQWSDAPPFGREWRPGEPQRSRRLLVAIADEGGGWSLVAAAGRERPPLPAQAASISGDL